MKKMLLWIVSLLVSAVALAQELSAAEKATLIRMYEEEKMAREVYEALNTNWQRQVFKNIAAAEEYHMTTVKMLAGKFGLQDQLPQNKTGVFADKSLQSMYDELVSQGSQSLEAALKAGARIEETDIADLEKAMAATSNADLKSTYRYLISASENHLRAFVGNLKRQGYTYKPQVLDQQRFNKIIAGSNNQPGVGSMKRRYQCQPW